MIWRVHLIYSERGWFRCDMIMSMPFLILHQDCSLAMCQAMPEFLLYYH